MARTKISDHTHRLLATTLTTRPAYHPQQSRRRRRSSAIAYMFAAVLTFLTIVGCSSQAGPDEDSAGQQASGAAQPQWNSDCDTAMATPVDPAAPRFALLVDRTASAAESLQSPALLAALARAQEVGAALLVVGVDGTGVTPTMLGPLALDQAPGNDSTTADRGRLIVLGCAEALLRDERLLPKSASSDILAALSTVLSENPAEIVISSDGADTATLETVGWDPPVEEVVTQLRAQQITVPPKETPVTWVGIGRTDPPINDGARAALTALWEGVLSSDGANVEFSTAIGEQASRSIDGLPADTFQQPSQTTINLEGHVTCQQLPSLLLFEPDSAHITSTAALTSIVDALTTHSSWQVVVEGHAATYGSAEGRMALSEARARAVAQALQELGVTNPMRAIGYGATRPSVPEWHADGTHDLAAASANRRVDIRYGPPGSIDTDQPC